MSDPDPRGSGLLRSRWTDGALALSVLCLAAAATYRLAPHEAAPKTPGAVQVDRPRAPAPCPSRTVPAPEGRPGFVGFDLPGGRRATGILGARVFPETQGTPELASSCDEAWAQTEAAELDLRPWLARETPSGPHLLQFWLRVDDAGREEVWTGWTHFVASDLYHSAIRAAPREDASATIEVRLAAGDPVPGALVGLAPVSLPARPASVLVYTGADGTCRVRGLTPDVDWVAHIPDGVGPSRGVAQSRFRPPKSRVVLTSELTGRWTFAAHTFELPLPGASVEVAGPEGAEALPSAWPVSRWVGPGRGPRTPFFVMTPRTPGAAGPPLDLAVYGFAAARLPDASAPSDAVFSTTTRRIEVRPAAARR